ncbi:MAG TPA: YciI family protein [Iamia sp.]
MKYMLLLRHTPDAGPAEGTPEFDAEMAKWGEVMGELTGSGVFLDAKGLDSEATATTVRIRDDEALVTDGPFAETKESFFSYIVIDVADLDTALGWAKRMPNVTYGSVEVRPLSPHEQDA